ncbi:hypothetical protein BC829DRAFT_395132 [Chytridium lagenaria]|nr:hypothetical protein BC829DRAFT_395132 [Chytridium lagenaria]
MPGGDARHHPFKENKDGTLPSALQYPLRHRKRTATPTTMKLRRSTCNMPSSLHITIPIILLSLTSVFPQRLASVPTTCTFPPQSIQGLDSRVIQCISNCCSTKTPGDDTAICLSLCRAMEEGVGNVASPTPTPPVIISPTRSSPTPVSRLPTATTPYFINPAPIPPPPFAPTPWLYFSETTEFVSIGDVPTEIVQYPSPPPMEVTQDPVQNPPLPPIEVLQPPVQYPPPPPKTPAPIPSPPPMEYPPSLPQDPSPPPIELPPIQPPPRPQDYSPPPPATTPIYAPIPIVTPQYESPVPTPTYEPPALEVPVEITPFPTPTYDPPALSDEMPPVYMTVTPTQKVYGMDVEILVR